MTIEELYGLYLECGGCVSTDSRSIGEGEMFFALKGENFDGNDFVAAVLEKGAAYAVADRAGLPEDSRIIMVQDVFTALRELAVWHRTHVRGGALPVIGLTGTNGKTTTKNLIYKVLSEKYRVTATQGNLNNDIGVPLSLLSIREDTEIAVIEMGANHPDDIERLVQVSQPDYGLVTNVGRAHLLGFGSFEGVVAAKTALYRWLGSRKGSLIFVNEDDALLKSKAAGQPCHSFGYGLEYQGAEVLPVSEENPCLRLRLDGKVISTRLVGPYNAANVLAAIAVGDYFGVPRDRAAAAIEAFEPDNKRSEMRRTGNNTLIIDAYNANPSSMAAALDNFEAMLRCAGAGRRGLALLGEMRELGADSLREHAGLLRRLRALAPAFSAPSSDGVPCAFLVGEEFRKALDECGFGYAVIGDDGKIDGAGLREGDSRVFVWSENSGSLAAYLAAHPVKGRLVLIKGSRGTRMEKTVPVL